jgi:hypothetical protein
MELFRRLFGRRGQAERRSESSIPAQTNAEQDAANKYWKLEVSADQQRRGKPDKR